MAPYGVIYFKQIISFTKNMFQIYLFFNLFKVMGKKYFMQQDVIQTPFLI